MLYESYSTQGCLKANIALSLPHDVFLNQARAGYMSALPGFLKLILCGSSICMFVYVCVSIPKAIDN